MHRWEVSDTLLVGFVLAIAALLVVSAACFGLGTLVMLRGGLPAVVARRAPLESSTGSVAGPSAGTVAPTLTPTVTLTPTLTLVPVSTPDVTETLTAPVATLTTIPFASVTLSASAMASPTFVETPILSASDTPVPTATSQLPTPPPGSTGGIVIFEVDKLDEWVMLFNIGAAPVDLTGWTIVSENGSATCNLVDVSLGPQQTLRIWTMAQDAEPGDATCNLNGEMWNDDEPDPAALYNAEGQLVDHYPPQ